MASGLFHASEREVDRLIRAPVRHAPTDRCAARAACFDTPSGKGCSSASNLSAGLQEFSPMSRRCATGSVCIAKAGSRRCIQRPAPTAACPGACPQRSPSGSSHSKPSSPHCLSVKALIRAARERGVDHPLAPSTVHRLLSREGLLDKRPGDPAATDRRRFAFRDAGELWMSDGMHGPKARDGRRRRKTFLIAFIDHADIRIMPRWWPGPLQVRTTGRGMSA